MPTFSKHGVVKELLKTFTNDELVKYVNGPDYKPFAECTVEELIALLQQRVTNEKKILKERVSER